MKNNDPRSKSKKKFSRNREFWIKKETKDERIHPSGIVEEMVVVPSNNLKLKEAMLEEFHPIAMSKSQSS